MIIEKDSNEQLPNERSALFSELQLSKHLRKAGIRKSFGFSCAYLFQLVTRISYGLNRKGLILKDIYLLDQAPDLC